MANPHRISTVLVINDPPRIRERLVQWLAEANYACMLVDTYEQAAALLQVRQFDALMYGHEFIFEGKTSGSTFLY